MYKWKTIELIHLTIKITKLVILVELKKIVTELDRYIFLYIYIILLTKRTNAEDVNISE